MEEADKVAVVVKVVKAAKAVKVAKVGTDLPSASSRTSWEKILTAKMHPKMTRCSSRKNGMHSPRKSKPTGTLSAHKKNAKEAIKRVAKRRRREARKERVEKVEMNRRTASQDAGSPITEVRSSPTTVGLKKRERHTTKKRELNLKPFPTRRKLPSKKSSKLPGKPLMMVRRTPGESNAPKKEAKDLRVRSQDASYTKPLELIHPVLKK